MIEYILFLSNIEKKFSDPRPFVPKVTIEINQLINYMTSIVLNFRRIEDFAN